jgi:hypothetical protein
MLDGAELGASEQTAQRTFDINTEAVLSEFNRPSATPV